MNPVVTAHVLLFDREGNVLLVRHEEAAGHLSGLYGLPGGRMDPDEQLIDTAIRECDEETGLIVCKKDLHAFPNNHYGAEIMRKDGNSGLFKMYVFVGNKYKGDLKPSDETTPEWVEVKDIYRLRLLPNVAKAVMAGLDFIKTL